jgi:hypothetical protein
MSLNRSLSKFIDSEAGGGYGSHPTEPELFSESLEDIQSVLYPEVLPQAPAKKHSADFLNSRLKARHIAENKLTQLSDDLLKLAEAVRYCHPLMAEALDDAWDATEAAITLMSYSES